MRFFALKKHGFPEENNIFFFKLPFVLHQFLHHVDEAGSNICKQISVLIREIQPAPKVNKNDIGQHSSENAKQYQLSESKMLAAALFYAQTLAIR